MTVPTRSTTIFPNGDSIQDIIDAAGGRVSSGLLSERPVATSVGEMYFATDTLLLYISRQFGPSYTWLAIPYTMPRPVESFSSSTDLSSYAVTGQYTALVNATSGNITITLPDVDFSGWDITVKKTDSSTNTVTVETSSSDSSTIDGESTVVISSEDDSVQVVSDGTNWYKVGSNSASFEVVNDETPQLGGDLDCNGNDIINTTEIVGAANSNVVFTCDTIGAFVFRRVSL